MDPNPVARLYIDSKATDRPEKSERLVTALDEIAAAFGLQEPRGVTPKRLREVIAGIEADRTGVLSLGR